MRKLVLCLALFPALLCANDAAALFAARCAPCHGTNGEGGRGSNLAVRRLPRAPDDATLSTIIRDGIPGTQMPGNRMTDAENRALTTYVRALGQSPAAKVPGIAANGETLFWNKGRCGQCHTVGPRGGRMGPDLTGIGSRRGPAHLRQSLLEPEAEVPETFAVYRRFIFMPDNFLQVRVVTADGTNITGARLDEDTFTIQLRDYADRVYSFRKDELRELHKDWGKSPMPGYRGVFNEAELTDLVAWLVSLQ
jgi:cytochrome c oxidase cbb3-type subunit III